MPIKEFTEKDTAATRLICENWGKHWPVDFPHKNITPKGHVLSYVIPKLVQERKTFYMFYKVEQKGESIHADLNDIARKVWCIRNKSERLWKLIERYELRNVSNVEIVNPTKRVMKRTRTHQFV